MSNLHDRQAAVDLIKAAIAPEVGTPLFNLQKGDLPGHEFHGNQYQGGGGQTAKDAEIATRKANDAAVSAQAGTGSNRVAQTLHTRAKELHQSARNVSRTHGNFSAAAYHDSAASTHEKMATAFGLRLANETKTTSLESHGHTSAAATTDRYNTISGPAPTTDRGGHSSNYK